MEDRYDALVIGSGIGGLAAAALLARIRGWRVCVLERHGTAGGFTHTFRRPGGWEWDVGVHYVGEMAEGTMPRRLMDAVTGGAVAWERLPEPFDRARYPGLQFAFGGDEARQKADLKALFPAESAGIDAWHDDLRRGARSLVAALMAPELPAPIRWALRKAGLLPDWSATETTAERLARRIGDPRLRALLTSVWGDYGVAVMWMSTGVGTATPFTDMATGLVCGPNEYEQPQSAQWTKPRKGTACSRCFLRSTGG